LQPGFYLQSGFQPAKKPSLQAGWAFLVSINFSPIPLAPGFAGVDPGGAGG